MTRSACSEFGIFPLCIYGLAGTLKNWRIFKEWRVRFFHQFIPFRSSHRFRHRIISDNHNTSTFSQKQKVSNTIRIRSITAKLHSHSSPSPSSCLTNVFAKPSKRRREANVKIPIWYVTNIRHKWRWNVNPIPVETENIKVKTTSDKKTHSFHLKDMPTRIIVFFYIKFK